MSLVKTDTAFDREKTMALASVSVDMPVTRFQRPSEAMVCEYGREISLSHDECLAFIDYFESNGWKVCQGKTRMSNWKAALRQWKRNSNRQASVGFQRPGKPGISGIMGGLKV